MLDTKKSVTADLEHSRQTRWLLGLVLAMAIVVSALEFTSSDKYSSLDELLADEIPEDMEFVPNVESDDELEQLKPQASNIAEELVEVNDAQNEVADDTPPLPPIEISLEVDPSIDDIVLTEQPVEVSQQQDDVVPLRLLERIPQFPGGGQLLMKWLTKNLKYPESARRQNIQGTVVASFVINADGTVFDPKIIKSVEPSLDREVLKTIRMMPRWEPGIYKEEPCRTVVHLPVEFKI